MPYLIVLALASAVGVAVYAITLRAGTHPAPIDAPAGDDAPAGPPTYLAEPDRPDWQERLTGLVGLLVAVVVGGVILAMALYVSVSTVIRIFI